MARLAAAVHGLRAFVLTLFQWLGRGLSWLARQLFGEVNWQAPRWLQWSAAKTVQGGHWLRKHPRHGVVGALVLAALAGGGWFGWKWYQSLPKPLVSEYTVSAPAATPYDDLGKPAFQPLVIEFNESVAPLKDIGKVPKAGIALAPAMAGEWRWDSDRKLVFRPKADWPIAAEFTVTMARQGLFAPAVKLDEYETEFKSAAFTAKVDEASFYQDPRDPNLKKLVATVHFSHPVDAAKLKEQITLKLGGGLGFQDGSAAPFALSFDKLKLNAYIHSAALAIPREDTELKLILAKGIVAARGGNGTPDEITSKISVPGLYSLRFDGLGMTLVDNERFEPEQVLVFSSNVPVSDQALNGHVKAWLLPEFHPDTPKDERSQPTAWSLSRIDQASQKLMSALPLKPVPGEDEYSLQHGQKFDAPVGRYVYVKIDQGVSGFGGYQSGKESAAVFKVAPYPQAVKLLSQGALLSLNGEKKVAFVARGLPGVRIEIGRVLPNQLHHLVDQNRGDFARPDFSEEFIDGLTERLIETKPLPPGQPGKPFYDSVDLSRYLVGANGGRHGVFMLRLSPFNPKQPSQVNYEPNDSRFVLVTDLGMLSKTAVDGSRDVFVQSISTGLPVGDARVDVIGKNGLSVISAMTDATGHARLPVLKDLVREKAPLMLMVSKGDDLSFLPLYRYDRELNLSRFDVGGIENAVSAQQLSAFVFTDRGLIRPSETAHIGVIARTANWQGNLAGVPLEVEVTDPRGLTVLKDRIKLSPTGFESFDFASTDTAATGEYQVGVYLVRDDKRGEQIGNGSFKVQEFEPDRMKVTASLSKLPMEGWIRPDEVVAGVQAMQLFGAPAAGRKVEADVSLSPAIPAFAKYPDYRFSDLGSLQEPFRDQLAPATTDDKGEATLALNLTRFARATYRLHLTARVFEAGSGRGVAAETATLVSSAAFLVGVKADGPLDYVNRGSKRSASFLAIGPDLKPVAADKLSINWVERRYVSVLVKQSDGTYRYQSRLKEIVRDSKAGALPAAATDLPLPTDEPGDFALVIKGADGAELNRIQYTVAGAANLSRSLERNAELQLTLNKKGYTPGDTIEVNIRAPYTGAGLITIERDKVYQHVWFKADTTSSVQKITLPKEFEGNGYVSVQFVRDPASDEVFMSPLSYGVAPFAVNLDARKLKLKLDTPKEVKPGQKVNFNIATDETARVALIAVDEGILQVARYKTPDPLGFFFQKRSLDVKTSQILDLILPEFAKLMQAAAPGGDGEGALGRHLNPFKRKHQPPVAYWSGLVETGPAGKALSWTAPDTFNGKLRVFAVAVSAQKITVEERATLVKGDLILSPNVPPAVAPGDEFTVSVGVFNNMRSKADVTLALTAGPGVQIVKVASPLSIAPLHEGVAEVVLRATDTLGDTQLRFAATAAGGKSGKAADSLSVRPPVAYRTQLTVGSFSSSPTEVALGRQLYPQYRKVEAGVAGSPLVWANGLAAYLEGYGYGCTEQLVSKAMPALLLTPAGERAAGKPLQVFNSTLRVLRERQNDDGGFGLWAANPVVSKYAAIYAYHYLLEARERSLPVPNDLLRSGKAWLGGVASGESEGLAGARERAYAIYLLTRMGDMTSGQLAALQQELDARYAKAWQQDTTALFVAASYKLLKQDGLADKLVKNVPWLLTGKAARDGDVYDDPLSHDAFKLYLLSRHFPQQKAPAAMLDAMGKVISSQQYATFSAAQTLLALDAYAAHNRDEGGAYTLAEVDRAGKASNVALPAGPLGRAPLSVTAARARMGKDGNAPAWYAIAESGFDRNAPTGEVKQGLEVVREYLSLDGKPLAKVKIGDEFLVRIRLRATERDSVSQVAVVDLLPGGVEIVPAPRDDAEAAPAAASEGEQAEGDGGESEGVGDVPLASWQPPVGVKAQTDWQIDYLEQREDRLIIYGSAGHDAATFVYKLRATHAGKFKTPAPYAEAMYNPRMQARGAVGSLEIVKP
ncbi:putative lipoprotein YfhM [Andreprevotia sp. IGB-42]|uniref:alpha-2-macroglobulin n=1 Tax=Andreprevotia sp. IGB-42 TaxID=2497473 RepID=UPI00135C6B53|nr:alpha-2-macroglobulin [Andreprevotia sp. IGB-42]KAF0814537.1 putative lipoprotein YfhM [Andreprevotia sp. IGB-42]